LTVSRTSKGSSSPFVSATGLIGAFGLGWFGPMCDPGESGRDFVFADEGNSAWTGVTGSEIGIGCDGLDLKVETLLEERAGCTGAVVDEVDFCVECVGGEVTVEMSRGSLTVLCAEASMLSVLEVAVMAKSLRTVPVDRRAEGTGVAAGGDPAVELRTEAVGGGTAPAVAGCEPAGGGEGCRTCRDSDWITR